ncbi:MAG: helix-turn-helix transcriptional regulator [Agitococcus sp.]|nr:helix-turn-helix transcriptional regulator [Agitococcus sp.]
MKTIKKTVYPVDPFIDTMFVVAAAIKAARTQAGMRIADAALVAHVSLATMVAVEAGRPGVSFGKVLQIADALGVSLLVVPACQRNRVRQHLSKLTLGDAAC